MDKWVTIKTVAQPSEAYVLRSLLESGGIECQVLNENTIQVNPLYSHAVGGAQLQVRECDVEDAIAVMKDGRDQSEATTTTATHGMICPYCGSTEISRPKQTQMSALASFVSLILLGLPIPFFSRKCHCFNCGMDFREANAVRGEIPN